MKIHRSREQWRPRSNHHTNDVRITWR